jgi:hypothetical protein
MKDQVFGNRIPSTNLAISMAYIDLLRDHLINCTRPVPRVVTGMSFAVDYKTTIERLAILHIKSHGVPFY